MKRLKIGPRNLLRYLTHQFDYFSKLGKLDPDGSFFKSDRDIAKYLNDEPVKNIKRWKRILMQAAEIKYETGKWKGCATKYWIAPKEDKIASFQSNVKTVKLFTKGYKLSNKEGKNGPPIVEKEEINKKPMDDRQRLQFHEAVEELKDILENGGKNGTK